MRRALVTAWFWSLATWRRTWCRTFGCVRADARWHFVGSKPEDTKRFIGVAVHCRRCWRRYTDEEKQRAVKFLQETSP